MEKELRVIISGGGTGGHIFPAVSIANAIKAKHPEAKILFVGALGRMEMQRVPQAGYEIKGLPVRGLVRPIYSLKNIGVAIDFLRSKLMAKRIVRTFRPDVAVGVGGYAGKTNKMLANKVEKICVAYNGMERFFPSDKIIITGNPVRQNVVNDSISKEEARQKFGLDPNKKTVLLVGGSLGARTINDSMRLHLDEVKNADAQFIWQTGKYYNQEMSEAVKTYGEIPNLKVLDFISDMGAAYKAADLVISRAGASSISEFCLIGKPVILVPSPNVAEDHQTKNAMALVNKDAAIYVKDAEAPDMLLKRALDIINDEEMLTSLSENIKKLGLPNSADIIADEVLKLVRR